MSGFRAIVIEQQTDASRITAHTAEVRMLGADFLRAADEAQPDRQATGHGAEPAVTIAVEYSGLNFKDGLALAGRPGVIKGSPRIPGIDLVGTVEESDDPRWRAGDPVILNGDGIGEGRNGGLSERARVRGRALVRLPEGLTPRRAAAIGTAGFTAMLSVLALEKGGVLPGGDGGTNSSSSTGGGDRTDTATATDTADAADTGTNVLVTGAAGGVGSVAVALLARLGYRVTASTGRAAEESDYLHRLGASAIIDRGELSDPGKPLQRQRWHGVLDAVGSHTLANALAQTYYGGTVTACGLAQGPDLPATVMPFILRAVSLVGINSVDAPLELRERAWKRLASDLDPDLLDEMTSEVGLADVVGRASEILAGRVRGRTVVNVRA